MNQYSNRAIEWMKAIGYLPEQQEQWEIHLQQMQNQYKQYVQLFTFLELQILSEIKMYCTTNNYSDQAKKQIVEKYMNYEFYIQNEFMHKCLENDVIRTHYQQFHQSIDEKIDHYFYDQNDTQQFNQYDIMRRILYIYGRQNISIGYISGMNYVLAPLLLVIQNEADCFFCFTRIMTQLQDVFIKDQTKNGVNGLLQKFEHQLQVHQPHLFTHLTNLGLSSSMYCLQWFITCFTLNFPLEITLHIWDRMLQTKDYRKYQIDVAIKMITSIKQDLLTANVENALLLLTKMNNIQNEQYQQL